MYFSSKDSIYDNEDMNIPQGDSIRPSDKSDLLPADWIGQDIFFYRER
jgi:hypothetical protein